MGMEGNIVCVTGASGYTASWLVKLLLLRGYTVNGTVHDLNDQKKVDHLVALEGAKERLHLFQAELMEEGSFDAAIRDCVGVFHTASPSFFECEDPQAELIDPAVKGTINVLGSCTKAPYLKRVVLTSSIGAMLVNDKPIDVETEVNESWWSDSEFCIKQKKWYAASKILAEEAAWNFAKQNGIDLVTICPGWTLGPLLQPTLNLSCAVISNLIGAKTCPNAAYGWVNVKDVGNAHIQAFEIQSANGRYCLVERDVHFYEIIKMLQAESDSPHQLCDKDSKSIRTALQGTYIPSCKYSRKKAESLGIEFTPFEIGLKETIQSFKEKQFSINGF